jgi:hypothetical protein
LINQCLPKPFAGSWSSLDPNDAPTEEVLKKIPKEKEKLNETRENRKVKQKGA